MRGLTSAEYDAMIKLNGQSGICSGVHKDRTPVHGGLVDANVGNTLLKLRRTEQLPCGNDTHIRVSSSGHIAMRIHRMMMTGTVEV